MDPDPTMLELLRSRLTDLEARQRAAGGVAERGFWDRITQASATRSSSSSATSAPSVAGRGTRGRRSHDHDARIDAGGGPWATLPPGSLASLDPRALPWLDAAGYDEMVDDPTWIEATARRGEERARREARAGTQGAAEHHETIACDALVGFDLTPHAEADLTAAAERVAQQRRSQEVALVGIVSELVSRGVEAPDGLSRTDWLRRHDPSLTAGQAAAFVTPPWPTPDGLGCACSSSPSRSPSGRPRRSSSSMHGRGPWPTPTTLYGTRRPDRAGAPAAAGGARAPRAPPRRADPAAPRRGPPRPWTPGGPRPLVQPARRHGHGGAARHAGPGGGGRSQGGYRPARRAVPRGRRAGADHRGRHPHTRVDASRDC